MHKEEKKKNRRRGIDKREISCPVVFARSCKIIPLCADHAFIYINALQILHVMFSAKLWSIIDTLRSVRTSTASKTYDIDRIIADKIVNHMLALDSICSDRMGTMHTRIHPLK